MSRSLQDEIQATDEEMWALLRKLNSAHYESVWQQYEDVLRAASIAKDAQALRRAADIVARRSTRTMPKPEETP